MFVRGRDLVVQRQTMGESVSHETLVSPSGGSRALTRCERTGQLAGERRGTSWACGARATAS